MAEVVYRRYDRMIREEEDLPQLIIVDGGKGQLSAAVKALEALNLRGKIAIIGIAKRLEEIYFPDDPIPLYIDKNSESLKIIQHLRNEAHRFGINFHRLKRSGSMIKSKLEEIPGIGNQTIQTLISYFGSVDILKEKTETEIAEVIGKSKAKIITNYFSGKTGTV
jgi:excinuclease ABC subunit C